MFDKLQTYRANRDRAIVMDRIERDRARKLNEALARLPEPTNDPVELARRNAAEAGKTYGRGVYK
jgi:hypothetical protein